VRGGKICVYYAYIGHIKDAPYTYTHSEKKNKRYYLIYDPGKVQFYLLPLSPNITIAIAY
jgi:hypothetical protein